MIGVKINVKATLNESHIEQEYKARLKAAQPYFDSMVLTDSNYFVPLKTGTLQKSAIINSRLGSGVILWRTPYARRLYYEYKRPDYQANPNASAKWFEVAKARYFEKWVNWVKNYVKR